MIDKLLNKEVQKFIQDHLHDDPVSLMLQANKYTHLPLKEIADQIKARQRLKNKLPEWVQNEKIIFPASLSQEQSSSQKTAIYKSKLISGNSIADLTGGAGVDTWYFSKVFNKVNYIEPNNELFKITRYNLSALGGSNIQYFNQKAEDYLENNIETDWIYLDPDRRGSNNRKFYVLTDCVPDVLKLLNIIWLRTSSILIKTSPMLDIKGTVNQLENVVSLHVVAVENDVKEVLYILNKKEKDDNLKVYTVNFLNDGSQHLFQFDFYVEKEIQPHCSPIKKYLYEPNAAILKAGAFRSIAQQFEISKLHPNTHLYTSDKLIDFPGRIFKVNDVIPFQKKQLLSILPEKKANITTRNFPISVEAIRKKTGIKDGGNIYLFGATDLKDKPIIIICDKIREA